MAKLPLYERELRFTAALQTAMARGGRLLSDAYLGVDHAHDWECAKGHHWRASYDCVINRKQWCGQCSGRVVVGDERVRLAKELAASRGGICVSETYTNSHARLKWRCREGHNWSASFSNIQSGKWCPWCAGNTVDALERIHEAQNAAHDRGGKCLSDHYDGNKTKMRWRCANGHEWSAGYGEVVTRRSWCGLCTGTARDADMQLARAREVATSKNGRCLSGTYVNSRVPMEWECERGHNWGAPFHVVVQAGTWCPECSGGLRERLTRDVFEQLFKQPFKKLRPAWLVNAETGRKMELDGGNLKLGIAFEYQGEQHYRQVKKFKMDGVRMAKQMQRDSVKRQLCEVHGVHLIEVHYSTPVTEVGRIVYEYVAARTELQHLLVVMRHWRDVEHKDWTETERYSLRDLKAAAAKRGGECLSGSYFGIQVKHHWRCGSGHEWMASWDSVQRKSWCPVCAGNIVDYVALTREAQRIALAKGGECLTTQVATSNAPLEMRCKAGHLWSSRFDRLKAGRWCAKCATKNRYER